MAKKNKFHVKEFEENNITVEEERKYRSPFILFFKNNGRLIFTISLLLSITVFIIAVSLTISNLKDSSIVMYESNGVIVSFDNTDNSIMNGTPITKEYANKLFDSSISNLDNLRGVVIRVREVPFKGGIIVFYSDNTALIKNNDGTYLRVFSVNGDYGVDEDGLINSSAVTIETTGERKTNNSLGISIIYLSDGSVEVTKDNNVFFIRNSDLTSNDIEFYTNLSLVSLPIKKEGNKVYYSKGTIKENNHIIVDGVKYDKTRDENTYHGIKITYYENGYAEVTKGDLSIIVEKSEHIKYYDGIFEIVENSISGEYDIKDLMDIKEVNIKNTNLEAVNYMIVLEETDNYEIHNVNKRLSNDYINFNVLVNGNMVNNKVLNNNLKDNDMNNGISLENNTYLLYEGKLEKLSEANIKLGLWISYEDITNEYMNSAFIGTVKVYVESLS